MVYLIILSAAIIFLIISSASKPNQIKQEIKNQPQRAPLTDAENEAIRQAREAFDFDTQISIIKGTYTGPLPEHVAFDKWTDLMIITLLYF